MKVEVPVHKFLLKTLFAITLLLSGQAGWAEDYRLVSSPDSNRIGQTPLEGAIVSGDLYGRMLPETGGITRVFYYLDGSTSQFKTEFRAPYDLNGGPSSGARPYDTTALSDGAHTIRAEVLLSTVSSSTSIPTLPLLIRSLRKTLPQFLTTSATKVYKPATAKPSRSVPAMLTTTL